MPGLSSPGSASGGVFGGFNAGKSDSKKKDDGGDKGFWDNLAEFPSLVKNAVTGLPHFGLTLLTDPVLAAEVGTSIAPGIGTLIGGVIGGAGSLIRHGFDDKAPWSETGPAQLETLRHLGQLATGDASYYTNAYRDGHALGAVVGDLGNISLIGGAIGGVGKAATSGAAETAAKAATANEAAAALARSSGESLAEAEAASAARLAQGASIEPAVAADLTRLRAQAAQHESAAAATQSAWETAQAAADTAARRLNTYQNILHLADQGAMAPFVPWQLAKQALVGAPEASGVLASRLNGIGTRGGLVGVAAEKLAAGDGRVAGIATKAQERFGADGVRQRYARRMEKMRFRALDERFKQASTKMIVDAADSQWRQRELFPTLSDQIAADVLLSVGEHGQWTAAALSSTEGRAHLIDAYADLLHHERGASDGRSLQDYKDAIAKLVEVHDPQNVHDPAVADWARRVEKYVQLDQDGAQGLRAQAWLDGMGRNPDTINPADIEWQATGREANPRALETISRKGDRTQAKLSREADRLQAKFDRLGAKHGWRDASIRDAGARMIEAAHSIVNHLVHGFGPDMTRQIGEHLAQSADIELARIGERIVASGGLDALGMMQLTDRVLHLANAKNLPTDPVVREIVAQFRAEYRGPLLPTRMLTGGVAGQRYARALISAGREMQATSTAEVAAAREARATAAIATYSERARESGGRLRAAEADHAAAVADVSRAQAALDAAAGADKRTVTQLVIDLRVAVDRWVARAGYPPQSELDGAVSVATRNSEKAVKALGARSALKTQIESIRRKYADVVNSGMAEARRDAQRTINELPPLPKIRPHEATYDQYLQIVDSMDRAGYKGTRSVDDFVIDGKGRKVARNGLDVWAMEVAPMLGLDSRAHLNDVIEAYSDLFDVAHGREQRYVIARGLKRGEQSVSTGDLAQVFGEVTDHFVDALYGPIDEAISVAASRDLTVESFSPEWVRNVEDAVSRDSEIELNGGPKRSSYDSMDAAEKAIYRRVEASEALDAATSEVRMLGGDEKYVAALNDLYGEGNWSPELIGALGGHLSESVARVQEYGLTVDALDPTTRSRAWEAFIADGDAAMNGETPPPSVTVNDPVRLAAAEHLQEAARLMDSRTVDHLAVTYAKDQFWQDFGKRRKLKRAESDAIIESVAAMARERGDHLGSIRSIIDENRPPGYYARAYDELSSVEKMVYDRLVAEEANAGAQYEAQAAGQASGDARAADRSARGNAAKNPRRAGAAAEDRAIAAYSRRQAAMFAERAKSVLDDRGRVIGVVIGDTERVARRAGVTDERLAAAGRDIERVNRKQDREAAKTAAALKKATDAIENAPARFRESVTFVKESVNVMNEVADGLAAGGDEYAASVLREQAASLPLTLGELVERSPEFDPQHRTMAYQPANDWAVDPVMAENRNPVTDGGALPSRQTVRSLQQKEGITGDRTAAGRATSATKDLLAKLSQQQVREFGHAFGKRASESDIPEVAAALTHLKDALARGDDRAALDAANIIQQAFLELPESEVGKYVAWDSSGNRQTRGIMLPDQLLRGYKEFFAAKSPEGQAWVEPVFIPEHLVKEYHRSQRLSPLNPNMEAVLQKWVDRPTRVWRDSVLLMRPAWQVGNIFGNAITAMVGAGVKPWDYIPLMRRSFELLKSDSLESFLEKNLVTERQMQALGEGHAIYSLMHRDRGFFDIAEHPQPGAPKLRTPEGKLQLREYLYGINGFVDDASRLSIFMDKVEKGYTDREIAQYRERYPEPPGITSTREQTVAEMGVRESLRAAGDFQNLSPFERYVVRRVIPFYPWLKHITTLSMNLAVHHPLRIAWLMNLGRMSGNEDNPEMLWGAIALPGGGWLRLPNINPFGDFPSLLGISADGPPSIRGLASNVNPLLDAASVGLGFGEFSSGGTALPLAPTAQAHDSYGRPVNSALLFDWNGRVPGLGIPYPARFLTYAENQFPQAKLVREGIPELLLGAEPVRRYSTGDPYKTADGTIPVDPYGWNPVGPSAIPVRLQWIGDVLRQAGVPVIQSPDAQAILDRAASRFASNDAAERRYLSR